MTTERNAQGVGVLAVMQASADQLWRYRRDILAREEEEARAAVADLIEAASAPVLRASPDDRNWRERKAAFARLDAALAPFQTGGAE